MLSEREVVDCKAHLKLGEGFLATAVIGMNSSEFEIRNALSRTYYAVFHASRAWLLTRGVPLKRSRAHGWLRKLVSKNRGEVFASRLKELYWLRENPDYRPELGVSYGGDVGKLRLVAETKVEQARIECGWYSAETRSALAGKR